MGCYLMVTKAAVSWLNWRVEKVSRSVAKVPSKIVNELKQLSTD